MRTNTAVCEQSSAIAVDNFALFSKFKVLTGCANIPSARGLCKSNPRSISGVFCGCRPGFKAPPGNSPPSLLLINKPVHRSDQGPMHPAACFAQDEGFPTSNNNPFNWSPYSWCLPRRCITSPSRLMWHLALTPWYAVNRIALPLQGAQHQREKNVPAQQLETQAQTRLSRANVHSCRSSDDQRAPGKRPQAADGITDRPPTGLESPRDRPPSPVRRQRPS